jgi:pilus assembly protein Flp/PilA
MEMKMTKLIKSLKKDESGAALIEYALICGLLLAVTVGVLGTIGTNLNTIFTAVKTATTTAATSAK